MLVFYRVLYDLDYGKIIDNILAHEDAVTCMAWGGNVNILISGSGDCTVKVWRGLSTGGTIKPLQCLKGQLDHNSHVTSLSFDS